MPESARAQRKFSIASIQKPPPKPAKRRCAVFRSDGRTIMVIASKQSSVRSIVPQEITVEKRLAVVEAELANGASRLAGSMKDEPEFAEVLRLGRAIRDADRPADD